jgi:RNA polymerase sigma factor (sigma-70 family)
MPNLDAQFDPLWSSFKNGDRVAFETLYRTYIGDLLNYGYKVSSNRSLIEDSIQDLFIELWQSRQNLANTTSVKFYLFRALRNKISRNNTENVFQDLVDLERLPDELIFPSHEARLIGVEIQSIQMENLKTLIRQLSARQQEAINLRYYHNFSNEEVAKIMGVKYQSACNFIFSALTKLKLNLKVSVSAVLFFLKFFSV